MSARLDEAARGAGANAIVGLRYEVSIAVGAVVVAFGTAVSVEQESEGTPSVAASTRLEQIGTPA